MQWVCAQVQVSNGLREHRTGRGEKGVFYVTGASTVPAKGPTIGLAKTLEAGFPSQQQRSPPWPPDREDIWPLHDVLTKGNLSG